MERKVVLGKSVRVTTRKTRAKQTKDVTEVNIIRTETNADGVFVVLDAMPEPIQLWDKMPKALETAIDNRLKAVLDDETLLATERAVIKGK